MNSDRLALLGIAIISLGFLVVAAGAFLGPRGSASSGGFVLIGPFPIVFGSGPSSGMLVTIALAISLVMVAFYLLTLLAWMSGKRRGTDVGTESE